MNIYIPKRDFIIDTLTSAFRAHYTEFFHFKGEAHNDWEMLFVEKGPLTVMEDERTYELSSGQAIFHKPMEFHQLKTEKHPDAKILVIAFFSSSEMIETLGEGIFDLTREQKNMLFETVENVKAAYDYVSRCDITKREGARLIDELLPLVKYEAFLLSVLSGASLKKDQENSPDAHNYRMIINVMHEHICERLSVEDIARYCRMSASNLKKVFRKHIDGGVMEYFNKLKILRAMELLGEGRSTAEVSEMLAFSSPNYFLSVFKRETGVLPSQYKKNPYDSRIKLNIGGNIYA